MIKKLFLLLIVAMLNVVAWAEPEIQISSYTEKQMVGNTKFAEPSVVIMDGSTLVTNQYNITYSTLGGAGGATPGESTTDDRGVAVSKDAATGTTVEVRGGNVIVGRSAGTVKIKITAVPKQGGTTLTKEYSIIVESASARLVFTPSFADPTSAQEEAGKEGALILTTKQVGWWYTKAAAILPAYKIVNETASGLVNDITDCYDVDMVFTSDSKNLMKLNDAKTKVEFAQGTDASGDRQANLTYRFTLKPEYAGYYSDIFDYDVAVTLNVLGSSEKKSLTMSLNRDQIKQVNVTEADGTYTIHVYKYGKSDLEGVNNSYQYKTPTPSLLADGTALPLNVTNGGGGYGDFKILYKIVEDNTYFDDCQFNYFSHTGTLQVEGEETGLTVNEYYFQVSKPGRVKVAAYAVLEGTYDDNGYGANLKAVYEPYRDRDGNIVTYTDQWGGNYTMYAEPIYFYIEVMKRQPTIVMTPDPTHLIFLKDDVITMNSRFDITAHKNGDSNGIEGDLIFGANDGYSDHFSYSFFISDRMESEYVDISWPNKEGDWNEKEGDTFSYIDWFKSGSTAAIQEGDLIKVGTIDVTAPAETDFKIADVRPAKGVIMGEEINVNGTLVRVSPGNIGKLSFIKKGTTVTINKYELVTDANRETLAATHSNLTDGDYERGITYISQKGYGNEAWTITFKTNGTYDIPYTARPYNHTRWDISDAKTVEFTVRDNTIPTQIELSYYFQNATISQDPFTEPTATVVTQSSRYDVTSLFTLSYAIDADPNSTGTAINASTGEVSIGSKTGDVRIKVSAERDPSSKYENPSPAYYTIRIIDAAGRATWEIISTDGTATHTACAESDRFDFNDTSAHGELDKALGRMHFLTTGTIYGGDVIEGVPGISMTVGNSDAEVGEWTTAATALSTKKCCSHESASVLAVSSKGVELGDNGIPTAGAFFVFSPTTNGFLTVDANFQNGHKISLISTDGDVEQFDVTSGTAVVGDHEFAKPLIAGKTYYLYDATAPLRLHGFRYEPAFIMDRNTTKAESYTPISATTFTNSLSNNVPALHKNSNTNVTYSVVDYNSKIVAPNTTATYLEVGTNTGALDPHEMTNVGDEIFQLRVQAVVASSEPAKWGTSVNKTPYYHISILDIPRYFVTSGMTAPQVGDKAYTQNIKTDIVMTYGGWVGYYNGETNDSYEYKGKDQVKAPDDGSSTDAEYSVPIDSDFDYYVKATKNPVDENNKGALVAATTSDGTSVQLNNNSSYTYASGYTYEMDASTYYNTTYRVPCRGAFFKFEPRESGTLMVYLCQDGTCDTYDGEVYALDSKKYQAKWRPLYITDETGKPVTMVNSFGNISQYLSTGEDAENSGSFTTGLSRCDINDPEVKKIWGWNETKSYGTSFDWTEFKGTDDDRSRIIAAWPNKGERISIVRLSNGGFAVAHKAYVRYAFEVKAGKTYFVFQPGSKPMFSGYAFVPTGFPDKCKYTLDSRPASYKFNSENQEKNWSGTAAATTEVTYRSGTQTAPDAQTVIDDADMDGGEYRTTTRDINFTWENAANFNATRENLVLTINDRRKSELTNDSYSANKTMIKPRTFVANKWESICLPFSVSEQEMKRVFGDEYQLVASVGVISDVNPTLKFIRHAHAYIEAGRPYFVKPSKPGVFSFRNVTIEGGNLSMEGGSTKVTDLTRFNVNVNREEYIFKGTYMRETMPAGSFFMYEGDAEHSNGLYKYTVADKIGGYRAYFNKPNGDTTKPSGIPTALFLDFNIEDYSNAAGVEPSVPTEVIAITPDGDFDIMPKNTGIYTIDGQKVSDNPLDFNNIAHGAYIINGKKYIK